MQVIRFFFQPRVINTLDELPEPSELLIVDPNMTLRDYAMPYEALFGYDDTRDPEP